MSTNPLPPKRLDPETTATHLFHLRQTVPLVHCLTNQVVQEITANVLLSAGASPAMIIAKEEGRGLYFRTLYGLVQRPDA